MVLFEEMLKHKLGSSFSSLNAAIKNIVTNSTRPWISLTDYNTIVHRDRGVYHKGWENNSDFEIKFAKAIELDFNPVTITDKQASILITAMILRNLGAHRIPRKVISDKDTLEKILTILTQAIIIIVREL